MKPQKPIIGLGALGLAATIAVHLDFPRLINQWVTNPTKGAIRGCMGSDWSEECTFEALRRRSRPVRPGAKELAEGLRRGACEFSNPDGDCDLNGQGVTLTLTAPESAPEELPKHLRELRAIFDTQNNPEKSPEK